MVNAKTGTGKNRINTLDQYVDKAVFSLTMSAANTLTSERINFNVQTLRDNQAICIHRVDLLIGQSGLSGMTADGDEIRVALALSGNLSGIQDYSNPGLLCNRTLTMLVGAAGQVLVEQPLVMDFSTLPGEGLLIPGDLVYLYMNSAGLAAAATVRGCLWYTIKQVTDKVAGELMSVLFPANL